MADGCAASSKIRRAEGKDLFSLFLPWEGWSGWCSLTVWHHGTSLCPKRDHTSILHWSLMCWNYCFLMYAVESLHFLLSSVILFKFTYSLHTYFDFSSILILVISISLLYYKLDLSLFFLISNCLLISVVLWVKGNKYFPVFPICSKLLNCISLFLWC